MVADTVVVPILAVFGTFVVNQDCKPTCEGEMVYSRGSLAEFGFAVLTVSVIGGYLFTICKLFSWYRIICSSSSVVTQDQPKKRVWEKEEQF